MGLGEPEFIAKLRQWADTFPDDIDHNIWGSQKIIVEVPEMGAKIVFWEDATEVLPLE